MKPFGAVKRTLHDCRVYRAGRGKKIHFTYCVKNRKAGRKFSVTE